MVGLTRSWRCRHHMQRVFFGLTLGFIATTATADTLAGSRVSYRR